jgi:hypothetical protein
MMWTRGEGGDSLSQDSMMWEKSAAHGKGIYFRPIKLGHCCGENASECWRWHVSRFWIVAKYVPCYLLDKSSYHRIKHQNGSMEHWPNSRRMIQGGALAAKGETLCNYISHTYMCVFKYLDIHIYIHIDICLSRKYNPTKEKGYTVKWHFTSNNTKLKSI